MEFLKQDVEPGRHAEGGKERLQEWQGIARSRYCQLFVK